MNTGDKCAWCPNYSFPSRPTFLNINCLAAWYSTGPLSSQSLMSCTGTQLIRTWLQSTGKELWERNWHLFIWPPRPIHWYARAFIHILAPTFKDPRTHLLQTCDEVQRCQDHFSYLFKKLEDLIPWWPWWRSAWQTIQKVTQKPVNWSRSWELRLQSYLLLILHSISRIVYNQVQLKEYTAITLVGLYM